MSDAALYAKLRELQPDLMVYIGSRWGVQPSTATLARINAQVAPSVHICSDAADPPWWDLLREYHEAGAFALQVAIDGNDQWPGAQNGLTLLTPIDAKHFGNGATPHVARAVACGYAGNQGAVGGNRNMVLQEVAFYNLVTMRLRDDAPGSYEAMCAFLCDSRMSLNIPYSGTETVFQVKGRVVESGLAGSCLLEVAGSPTNKWFTPGVDYLEYDSMPMCRELIVKLREDREQTERIGASLRRRALAEHSPAVFWGKVLEKIGMTGWKAAA